MKMGRVGGGRRGTGVKEGRGRCKLGVREAKWGKGR